MAYSFTTQGSTPPTIANAGFYKPQSTPQGKALSFAASAPSLTPPTTQDIKSHTDAQGNSQTYYPSNPSTSKVSTPNYKLTGLLPNGQSNPNTQTPDQKTGVANIIANLKGNSNPAGTVTPPAPIPPVTPATPPAPGSAFNNTVNAGVGASAGSYGQGTSNANTGTGISANAVNNPNPNIQTSQAGLLSVAANESPEVIKAREALTTFQKENPYMLAAQNNPNVAADIASGRSSLLGQTFGKEEQALETGVTNALAGQGQQITAGTNAGSQALTQQGNAITAGGNIAGTGTTQQGQGISGINSAAGHLQPLPNTPYAIDPTTGQPIGGGNVNNAIINSQNYQTVAQRTQAYNQGLSSIAAADNLEPQIVKTISENNLNNTPVSAITNLQQWFSGQSSDPAQQQLSQQVATYIQALGIDPATATNIAAQQRGTLGQLLKTLRQSAVAKNEGNNPATAPVAGQSSNDPLGIR